ncbi:MAG: hypothetical protein KAJ03_02900 [Gammaproteobacteria bacterium]|nr:hypothetical protein [Gammaproteobacteria bacterium]
MNEDEALHILKEMLGVDAAYRKVHDGLRNTYCTNILSDHHFLLRRMEVSGLVKQGRKSASVIFYHATEKGAKVAGLTPDQMQQIVLARGPAQE